MSDSDDKQWLKTQISNNKELRSQFQRAVESKDYLNVEQRIKYLLNKAGRLTTYTAKRLQVLTRAIVQWIKDISYY